MWEEKEAWRAPVLKGQMEREARKLSMKQYLKGRRIQKKNEIIKEGNRVERERVVITSNDAKESRKRTDKCPPA